jgi:hypothetical protein
LALTALLTTVPMGVAFAKPAGPGAFTLHLDCENGAQFDVLVPTGSSFAALVDGINSVAVLKGQDVDFDGIPDALVPGFTLDELTACTTFVEESGELIPIFVAYVLFTPRHH